MKKLYIIIIFCLAMLNANAQEHKLLIGGSVGLNFSSYSGSSTMLGGGFDKTFELSASPFVGYNLSKNFLAGIAVENYTLYTTYSSDNNLLSSIKQYDLLISPFLRYYFNVPLFLQGQFNIGQTKQTLSFNSNYAGGDPNDPIVLSDIEAKNGAIGYGFGLGYDIDLSERIKLEPLLKYVSNTYKDKESDSSYKTSGLYLNIGFIFRL